MNKDDQQLETEQHSDAANVASRPLTPIPVFEGSDDFCVAPDPCSSSSCKSKEEINIRSSPGIPRKPKVETFSYPRAPKWFRRKILKQREDFHKRSLTPVETHYTLSLANRLFMLAPEIYWTLRYNVIVHIIADRFYSTCHHLEKPITIQESVELSNSFILWHCKNPIPLLKLARILCGCVEGPECAESGTEGLCHHLKCGIVLCDAAKPPSSIASTSDLQEFLRSQTKVHNTSSSEDDNGSYTTMDSLVSVTDIETD